MRIRFDDNVDQFIEAVDQENYMSSEKESEDLYQKLYKQIHEKLLANEYRDYKQLGDDWDVLRKFYRENSRGPAKNEVGERLGLNKLYEGTDHFIFLKTA